MKNNPVYKSFWQAILMLFVSNSLLFSFSGEGSGSETDPYQITDLNQLQEMNDNLHSHYILMNDIDATETKEWNSGKGFLPVGFKEEAFRGSLDGNNFKITNLYINRPGQDYTGLFGYIFGYDAYIRNVELVDCDIKGLSTVGGIAGFNYYSLIVNCKVSGIIKGDERDIGGITGYNHGVISNSGSSAEIQGDMTVGGLCGSNYMDIMNCWSTANIMVESSGAGGLVAKNDGYIVNTYASGILFSPDGGSGLIADNSGYVARSYAVGKISNHSKGYGLIGNNNGTVESCFWDTQSTGKILSYGGEGKTTDEMKDVSLYINAGWNFGLLWRAGETYPYIDIDTSQRPVDTDDDGYLNISSLNDLMWLSESGFDLENKIELDNDIDASETESWNSGEGFLPIVFFSGIFDGNGYEISNLFINKTKTQWAGFFKRIGGSDTKIENLGLIDCNISGTVYVGGFAGWMSESTIDNSWFTGIIEGYTNVGGITGLSIDGVISNSFSEINIFSDGSNIGGLIGTNKGEVFFCHANSTISGTASYVGGLIGSNEAPYTVQQSYSTGDIAGNEYVGGLIGYNIGNLISNSYSLANVYGDYCIGGFIGHNKSTIINSYSAGQVTGTGYKVKGFVAYNEFFEASNCFWDTETSEQTSSETGTGRPTYDMKDLDNYTQAGWDFENIWSIDAEVNEGYPNLQMKVKLAVKDEETSDNNPLQMYPNPADEFVIITYPGMESVRISDISGRLLKETKLMSGTEKYTISLSGITSGCYIISIRAGEQIISQPLIIK